MHTDPSQGEVDETTIVVGLPAGAAPSQRVPTSVGARVLVIANVYATFIHGLVAFGVRDRPVVAWCIALSVVTAAGNFAFSSIIRHEIGYPRAEHGRAIWNVTLHGAIAVLTDWHPASWLFLPFIASLGAAPGASGGGWRLAGILISYAALGLATGAPIAPLIAFVGLSLYVTLMLGGYLALAHRVLIERDRIDVELGLARQAALAGDKLASIGQLAAGVAHEINNPMCFVSVNVEELLEVLRAEPDLPAALVPFRDEILPETQGGIVRVNAIVADLQQFARPGPDPLAVFDLSSELAAAVRMARTQVTSPHQLVVDVPPGLEIRGQGRQIGRAILNLIINGLQALGDGGGTVRVRAAPVSAGVEITVADDGGGVPPELLARLFDPFFTTRQPG